MIRRVVAAAAPPLCGLFLLVPTATGAPPIAPPSPEVGHTADPSSTPTDALDGHCLDAEGNLVPTYTFPPVDPTSKPKPTPTRPKPTAPKPRPTPKPGSLGDQVEIVDGDRLDVPDCPQPEDTEQESEVAAPVVDTPVTTRPRTRGPVRSAPVTTEHVETTPVAPIEPPVEPERPRQDVEEPRQDIEEPIVPPERAPRHEETPVAPEPTARVGVPEAAPVPAPRREPETTPADKPAPTSAKPTTTVAPKPVVVERAPEPFIPPSTTFLPETLPSTTIADAVEPRADNTAAHRALSAPRRDGVHNGWMLAMVVLAMLAAGGLLALFTTRSTPLTETADEGGPLLIEFTED